MVEDKIQYGKDTILASGYGIVAKQVMKDRRISHTAKAIYSYICSYAGASGNAYPPVGLICSDLQINKDTYYKHLKALREVGYISVEKHYNKGKFQNNVYIINLVPCPNSSDTVSSDTVKSDTNINSSNSNSLKSNKELFTLLQDNNDEYISFYLRVFENHKHRKHMRVSKESYDYILTAIGILRSSDIDYDEWRQQVVNHFNNLPKSNNGNILAFLKASHRYFEIDVDGVISGRY